MSPYDEIVKSLYDKDLVYPDALKICKVIYNKDNSKWFVILERTTHGGTDMAERHTGRSLRNVGA